MASVIPPLLEAFIKQYGTDTTAIFVRQVIMWAREEATSPVRDEFLREVEEMMVELTTALRDAHDAIR
jgi:hypothetical protein